ncbi:nitrite reductase subunit NirD [Klebsiella pneumoniae]|uniref:Nitrite reductase subunit NirD n=1 Tax=Klebsiella pneumoniae TaxID=573 RepID=A0A2X3G894_KLEPN|nr:nitrite reductase subunit NirD [Klebsiella pneumoniae]
MVTYSVIPRSAGGEITPEGLVAVGRIAREFNLYTKITGSQRIGLFGAQKDDLPEIWRQLIEAGFETGHAYAKALRMAKTCVGSTWCRYGVGDSVGFGVELENRYKGIRTPAQNEVRRLRLHPRMCRGSGQRRRDHRQPRKAGTCTFAVTAG